MAPAYMRMIVVLIVLAGFVSTARAQSGDSDTALNAQLESLRTEGRYGEAIGVAKRIVAGLEATSSLDKPFGAALLNNLGELHYKLGLHAEAVPFYERSLAIWKRTNSANNPAAALTQRNLATVYQLLGRGTEAEALYRESIATLSKVPGGSVQLASTINNLATLYKDTGRLPEAEAMLRAVLEVYRKDLGPGHPYVATALSNLGQLYGRMGDGAKARELIQSAYDISRSAFGPDHPQVAVFADRLANAHIRTKDYPKAVPLLREALGILERQARRGMETREGELSTGSGRALSLQQSVTGDFVNTAMQVVVADQTNAVELVREVFLAGQWRPSRAAQSLLAMSVRRMKGDGPLADIVRQRQDFVTQWQEIDRRLTERITAGSGADGDPAPVRNDIAQLQAIDGRIGELDQKLATQFPDFAAFANPKPLDVPAVQALLRENEALVLFIETAHPTWVWVVTKTAKSLALVQLGSDALAEETARLRCGLDSQDWVDPSGWPATTPADVRRKAEQAKRLSRCRTQSANRSPGPDGVLPFDVAHAHKLYRALFGGVAETMAGKELLIVPSPALIQMPFNALVAVAAPSVDLRNVKWLGTQSAITILPSVSTLAALRRNARPSAARRPFAGFGNPLLEGSAVTEQERAAANLAKAKQTCRAVVDGSKQKGTAVRNTVPAVAIGDAFSGAFGDVDLLRRQPPLPETADEICDVARRLGAAEGDVWLGARATEQQVKALDAAGQLADYRVLHFATHGLVSGLLPGLAEPALLLTPPKSPSEADDGLLTASEIAQLKIDADWVVLSACNTAAGGKDGAEGLSGLARAFFYAGARTVLVTHWEINSEAAVALTTATFDRLQKQPGISRSEALRRSMADLAGDATRPWAAHPSVWAAFEIVGEGAAAK